MFDYTELLDRVAREENKNRFKTDKIETVSKWRNQADGSAESRCSTFSAIYDAYNDWQMSNQW